jgi:acyl carrier protein
VSTANEKPDATLTDRVKQCVIDALGVKLTPAAIPDDIPLLDKGLGLDSVAILRLVSALESEFSIEIEDRVLGPELFRSVRSLSDYLATRIQEH